MTTLPEYVEGVPNISGSEAAISAAVAAGKTKSLSNSPGGVDFGSVRSAGPCPAHAPALGACGRRRLEHGGLIGNLQHMVDHRTSAITTTRRPSSGATSAWARSFRN